MKDNIIYASITSDSSIVIGSYDTEERAMEVFNDIYKCYDQEHVRVLLMPEK